MNGRVNDDLETLLRLTLRNPQGQPHEVEAVIDTGYNGFLTLPSALIEALGLPWHSRQIGELADGSILTFDVYLANVDWGLVTRTIEVDQAEAKPLLGTALLRGSELRIHVVPGGAATITDLPTS